jgi:hypothetical protein
LPTSKGLPSSLVQLRTVWTGVTRDTRPEAVNCGGPGRAMAFDDDMPQALVGFPG